MYFKLRPKILDKKCVKQIKFITISNPMIHKFDLFVLQFVLYVLQYILSILQIEALSNFLMYIKFIVVIMMFLSTIVQLFVDGLLFALMITTMLSLVDVVVIVDLM